jgi:Stress responsive A/B Barrel Domain
LIAHVVLFRLRPEASIEDRRALIDAFATALNDIPVIRRARVGQRVRVGRSYEALTRIDFPYAALLEFENVDGLRAYLDHPAHEAIAARFFGALADTLIYDFEVTGDAEGLRGMLSET